MKVIFSKELQDLDGQSMREGTMMHLAEHANGEIHKVVVEGKALTLSNVSVNALGLRLQDEQLTPEQHIERFMLTQRIYKAGDEAVELSSEEVSLIKKMLSKTGYGPLVVGQACLMLEGRLEGKAAAAGQESRK